jgi:hypothetical protein
MKFAGKKFTASTRSHLNKSPGPGQNIESRALNINKPGKEKGMHLEQKAYKASPEPIESMGTG